MHFSSTLRARIILSFLLFGTLLSGAFTYGIYFISERMETRLIDQILAAQMDYRIAYFRNTHTLPPDSTPQIRGYMTRGANNFGIPPYLAALSPGTHTIEYQGREYRVAVKQVDDMYFFATYDLAAEASDHLYLVLFLLAGLVLSVLAGRWLSRYALLPGIDADNELGALATAIDHDTGRIQAFIQRERDFANDASHELGTPLAALKGAVELLLTEPGLSAQTQKCLQRIERNVTAISDAVTGLLLLSHEPGSQPATATRYAVAPVLHEAVEQHRYLLAGKPIELVMETEAEPYITAAPPVLHIVLGNLVRNAFNYTTSGRIILRLGHDSVSIEDTGIGIPPHDLPHVYERHYRGSLAPSVTAGMGLGLSLVKRICDRYGWRIDIASKPGAGTRVQLSFGAAPSTTIPA
ncbi:MAG: HAMP domain-containing sensor histidine kinase [Gammaproteobacteria bacterium]|nr:HAMP domain-containing sensor histidine kinase [Gammaproteobacteria bacterium]